MDQDTQHADLTGRVVATTNPTVDHDPIKGARVEIVDPTGLTGRVILPTLVRVNGVDVGLLAENGVIVNAGSSGECATVTLVLMPESIEIKLEDS